MTGLDDDYVNRAAPPGSMRYFSLLYTPADKRELLTALFVVEAEIRASATQVTHEVAHTRMQWWRGEIDRLVNRNAQHPATRILQSAWPDANFTILHEFMVSADMDLARMTYNTASEFNGYLERSGAALELFAADRSAEARTVVRELASIIRRAETLRDLVMEARAGRIYWPLDELATGRIELQALRSSTPPANLTTLVVSEARKSRKRLDSLVGSLTEPQLRPLVVLACLHGRLLRRIERSAGNVFTERHELKPLEKVWTAWRAARLV